MINAQIKKGGKFRWHWLFDESKNMYTLHKSEQYKYVSMSKTVQTESLYNVSKSLWGKIV